MINTIRIKTFKSPSTGVTINDLVMPFTSIDIKTVFELKNKCRNFLPPLTESSLVSEIVYSDGKELTDVELIPTNTSLSFYLIFK